MFHKHFLFKLFSFLFYFFFKNVLFSSPTLTFYIMLTYSVEDGHAKLALVNLYPVEIKCSALATKSELYSLCTRLYKYGLSNSYSHLEVPNSDRWQFHNLKKSIQEEI